MSDGHEREVEELGRVLASDAFVASPMLAAFLRFVVEETLAGRADRLKAYTIAVGALDRPEDFDPNDNPLVRVQARRLRRALERHYLTDGRDADLVIELPLGTYVPSFVPRDAAARPTGRAPPPSRAGDPRGRPGSRHRRHRTFPLPRGVAPLLVLLVVATAFTGWYAGSWLGVPAETRPAETVNLAVSRSSSETETTVIGLDASRVLPLVTVTVDVREPKPFDFDAEVYRSDIESFAGRFDDAVVVTRRATPTQPTPGQPLYRLRFLVAREGGTTNAHVQLVHVADERVLRSTALVVDRSRSPAHESFATPADLAFVRDAVQLHGAISQDLANLPDLGPELACLTRAWTHQLEPSPGSRLAAEECLIPLVTANPRLAPALTMLGVVHLGEPRRRGEVTDDDPLARAEAVIRRATAITPTSSAPYQVLQNLLLARGDIDAAVIAGKRSVQNNPEDMNAIGAHGAVLARIGRYEEAVHLLDRAAANTAVLPKWVRFHAFLALNNLGRTREADDGVALLAGSSEPLDLAAAAIRAHRRGDEAAAAAAVASLLKAEPEMRDDPRAHLRRSGFTEAVADRFLVDLVAAGLHRARM
ncbi:MAG: tetratricopeptide repeat protein [Siculibacillus sp.]|nr:tetratricopeptide repeat protein [Siculibacillus sp.]